MKKHDLAISYTEFSGDAELTAEDLELLNKAREAAQKAYAPYSKFRVGAAVLLETKAGAETKKIIVQGNNQENAAYPSGLCAERVAIFSASANYPQEIKEGLKAIAVCCETENVSGKPFTPCGSCRQVLNEYEKNAGEPLRIILGGMKGSAFLIEGVKNVLPLAFEGEFLKG